MNRASRSTGSMTARETARPRASLARGSARAAAKSYQSQRASLTSGRSLPVPAGYAPILAPAGRGGPTPPGRAGWPPAARRRQALGPQQDQPVGLGGQGQVVGGRITSLPAWANARASVRISIALWLLS